tara:strand:- start:235 stop:336 length:102 start_codon:yes stop_codon:yes gene_type:complete
MAKNKAKKKKLPGKMALVLLDVYFIITFSDNGF